MKSLLLRLCVSVNVLLLWICCCCCWSYRKIPLNAHICTRTESQTSARLFSLFHCSCLYDIQSRTEFCMDRNLFETLRISHAVCLCVFRSVFHHHLFGAYSEATSYSRRVSIIHTPSLTLIYALSLSHTHTLSLSLAHFSDLPKLPMHSPYDV